MGKYRLSNDAKDDLIRIHRYGVEQFGMRQVDKYFEVFFEHFERISKRPYSFEAVDFIKPSYRRCLCGADTIYYHIAGDIVEVISIIGQQDLRKLR